MPAAFSGDNLPFPGSLPSSVCFPTTRLAPPT